MLGELIASSEDVAVLDMEASIEHMSRGTVRHVDLLLIVTEPYYRSLETAGRLAPLARDLGIDRICALANKIRDERDEAAVFDYCSKRGLEVAARVPFDPAIIAAERAGIAALDYDADAPAVVEIRRFAHWLTQTV
jgi:CO dehydrogenase maturation factor